MNSAAVDSLRRDGFAIVRSAITQEKIRQMQDELDGHFGSFPFGAGAFYGENTVRFGGVFNKSAVARELAISRELLHVVEDILAPNCDTIQINLTQAISIHPGEIAQIPHRDDDAFPVPCPGVNFMINCMIPLCDFNSENGGTRIWPGTHLGRKPYMPANMPDFECPEIGPGDLLFWVGSAIHGGGANSTKEERRGVVISYSLGWLRQAENQFLTYSRDQILGFPEKLRSLLGYQAHKPNLGWVDGQDPSAFLQSQTEEFVQTTDLLDPAVAALIPLARSGKVQVVQT